MDHAALASFSFLSFLEDIGLPFHIPGMSIFKNTVEISAGNIYSYCPDWAFFSVFRTYDAQKVGSLFNRNRLNTLDRRRVEDLFDKYLSTYESYIFKRITGSLDDTLEVEISILSIVPEILSRLVIKCSYSKKEKVIILLCRLYNHSEFKEFSSTKSLLEWTIKNLTLEQKIQLIPILIEFPIAPKDANTKPFYKHYFINPFRYLVNLENETITNVEKISSAKISKDITIIKSGDHEDRCASSIKLIVPYKIQMLNKSDEKLIKALWSKTDDFGFPDNVGYYNFFFIKDLNPSSENTLGNMLKRIRTYSFPLQEPHDSKSVGLTQGHSHYCHELTGVLSIMQCAENYLNIILEKITEWYNADRHWLNNRRPDDDLLDEFKRRFSNITRIIVSIIKYHEKTLSLDIKII